MSDDTVHDGHQVGIVALECSVRCHVLDDIIKKRVHLLFLRKKKPQIKTSLLKARDQDLYFYTHFACSRDAQQITCVRMANENDIRSEKESLFTKLDVFGGICFRDIDSN